MFTSFSLELATSLVLGASRSYFVNCFTPFTDDFVLRHLDLQIKEEVKKWQPNN
jgi:hypothetical protein